MEIELYNFWAATIGLALSIILFALKVFDHFKNTYRIQVRASITVPGDLYAYSGGETKEIKNGDKMAEYRIEVTNLGRRIARVKNVWFQHGERQSLHLHDESENGTFDLEEQGFESLIARIPRDQYLHYCKHNGGDEFCAAFVELTDGNKIRRTVRTPEPQDIVIGPSTKINKTEKL